MFAPPPRHNHTTCSAKNEPDWEKLEEALTDTVKGGWRFVSGDTLNGKPRTDRTWTHRGTTSIREDGRAAHRIDYLSRWETAGLRWFSSAIAAGTGYAYTQDPTTTIQSLQVSGLAAACSAASWAGFRGVDGVLTWRHRSEWVWPLHVVLRDLLGLPEGTKPRSYLSIPVDFQDQEGDVIRVDLPATWAGGGDSKMQTQIVQAINSKLGLQDFTASFKFTGRKHELVLRQSPRAPRAVMYADPEVRKLVEKASEAAPFLGLSHRNVSVAIDLDAESPHLMFSAAPGAGKSELAKAFACQLLHNGGIVVIVDFKRTSHKWAYGLPNVLYVRSEKDAHDVFIALANEGNRRMSVAEENAYREMRGESPLLMGPRIMVIVEEANTMRKRLAKHWAKNKPEGEKKNESPAVDALGEMLFMGRSQKMHVFMIGQSLTAQTVGGPEMREAFTARILARYTQNAWRMLVPEVSPIPKASRQAGRVQIVLAGSAHETQVVYFTDDEARDYATSGIVTPAFDIDTALSAADSMNSGHTPPSHLGKAVESDTTGRHLRAVPAHGSAPEETDPDAPIGLADAARTILANVAGPAQPGVTTPQEKRDLMALRNGRNRDPQFPQHIAIKGREKLYDPRALERWARNRVNSVDDMDDAETGTE